VILIADHCVYEPIIQALKKLQFPILSIYDIQDGRADYTVMQACLDNNGILITLDRGIPSQAYAFEYASKGLSVVLLRWKSSKQDAWQEMTEVILRESKHWIETAERETSIISVSYKGGSRPHAWSDISPQIIKHAFNKEIIPPDLFRDDSTT